MQVGSLVKTPVNGVAIVIDMSDEWSKKLYLLHYISGTTHWWAADHLEVICE